MRSDAGTSGETAAAPRENRTSENRTTSGRPSDMPMPPELSDVPPSAFCRLVDAAPPARLDEIPHLPMDSVQFTIREVLDG